MAIILGTSVPDIIVQVAPYGPRGPVVQGTSKTTVNISLGPKTFVMEEYGLNFQPGIRVRVSATGMANEWMEGIVTDYSGNELDLVVDLKSGTGNFSDWLVNVAGEPGSPGPPGPQGPPGPPGTPGSGTGYVTEAPNDGVAYGRQSLAWTHVLMATNDTVDGGNF